MRSARGDSYILVGGASFLDSAQTGLVLLRWSRERETGKVLTFAALLVPTPRPSGVWYTLLHKTAPQSVTAARGQQGVQSADR